MGNNVLVVTESGEEVRFEDVVGHQIGNGAVQILERNGNQRVFNKFREVAIQLDQEASSKFAYDLAEMEATPEVVEYEEISEEVTH